jgi:hypothetical protein
MPRPNAKVSFLCKKQKAPVVALSAYASYSFGVNPLREGAMINFCLEFPVTFLISGITYGIFTPLAYYFLWKRCVTTTENEWTLALGKFQLKERNSLIIQGVVLIVSVAGATLIRTLIVFLFVKFLEAKVLQSAMLREKALMNKKKIISRAEMLSIFYDLVLLVIGTKAILR